MRARHLHYGLLDEPTDGKAQSYLLPQFRRGRPQSRDEQDQNRKALDILLVFSMSGAGHCPRTHQKSLNEKHQKKKSHGQRRDTVHLHAGVRLHDWSQ